MAKANTDGFRVLPSYYEAIRDLPDDERLRMYDTIMDFGFGNKVGELPPLLMGYLKLIMPSLEKSMKFESKQKANGQKGGRPPKPKHNPGETQTKPSENLAIAVAVDVESDIDIEGAVDKADKPPRAARFTPPTVEEVRAYCKERGNDVDPARFCDFYTMKGWMVGSQRMKDWKAAVRTWERRDEGGDKHGSDAGHHKKSWNLHSSLDDD